MAELEALAWRLMNDMGVFRAGMVVTLVVSIAVIVMFALPGNRDERGWKILGKASVISFTVFMIMVNVIAKTSTGYYDGVSYIFFANVMQWLYNLVLAVEVGAVLVFRRLE